MSSSSSPTPTLTRSKPNTRDAMVAFGRELFAQFAGAQSGTIQAFYENQTADVAFNSAIVVGYQTDAKGQISPVTRAYPLLPAVPVLTLSGGGGAVTFPIKPGDPCLLVFLDRDQDAWITTGQRGLPPNTNRLHSLSDAIAIVGIRSLKSPLAPYSMDDAQFYGPDGPGGPIVSLGGGKVRIANATRTMKTNVDDLFDQLDQLISVLKNWVDTRGDVPNPATKAALDGVKSGFDTVKGEFDDLYKV